MEERRADGNGPTPDPGSVATPSVGIHVGAPPPSERVRLSLRLVLHLARYGPPIDGGSARPESTQEGIAFALAATQGAVSKILRLLSVTEVVRHERHHVPGRDRIVRAYYLTRRGELLAEEIRYRLGDAASEGIVRARDPSAWPSPD